MKLISLGVAWLAASAGAPPPEATALAAERQQLEEALARAEPEAQAAQLVRLLATGADAEVRRLAYRALARACARAAGAGRGISAEAEARLLAPGLGAADAAEKLAACYGLVETPALLELVVRCLESVPEDLPDPVRTSERARLAGTVAFLKGDMPLARQRLAAASVTIAPERDALMHLRLAEAQRRTGKGAAACATARELYRAQPLLGGAREALAACGKVEAVARAVEAEVRAALLKTRRAGHAPVAPLSLEDDRMQPVEVRPAETGRVLVLVFFSTWCPHCDVEMPRVVSFAKAVAADRARADKVELLGVRTAVEREREPYQSFAARHGIGFRVLTDATMSLVFRAFAKASGLDAGLPTIAVLDRRGVLRFVLPVGDYRDTARELDWAVRALLD